MWLITTFNQISTAFYRFANIAEAIINAKTAAIRPYINML